MTELGLLARFVHLSASILIVGSAALVLLAGRSDRPTALAWESRVVALTRALIWLALGAGVAVLAHQTAILESSVVAAFEPRALARVALETRFGHVWLVRQGLLLLLGVFVSLRLDVRRALDWRAARGETALLGALALAALGAAGHSAAVEPSAAAAIAADVGHLLAAGVWAGALPALVLLLRAASREAGADARPYAVLAARRFSRAALILMTALLATGLLITAAQVGSVGALLGTRYGRLLVLKLALVLAALAAAALGRRRPDAVPKLMNLVAGGIGKTEVVDVSHRVLCSRRLVRFVEMEYAIPRAELGKTLLRVRDLIEGEGLAVNFPIELRVAAADDIPLSTASGRETGYLAVHLSAGTPFDQYFRGVEAIMDDVGGRPHWGKMHYQTADTLAPRYPDWTRFQAVRARLDPDGRFRNPYLDRVLGPVASP